MINFGYNYATCCMNPFMNLFSQKYVFPITGFVQNSIIPTNIFNPFVNTLYNQNLKNNSIFNFNGQFYNNHNIQETDNLSDRLVLTAKIKETQNSELLYGAKYNKNKGEILAANVLEGLPTNRDPYNPLCARYVKNAIVKSGLGPYINGNGEYCKYILRANPNFKEVNVPGKELSKLPAGCIIVYDKFDGGYGKDGHVEITLGDGRACSDIINNEISESDRAYTFIPV